MSKAQVKRFYLLLTVLAATLSTQAQDNLLINEVMQSNIDCIMDDLNDFPDSWVELYNPTTEDINLQDYKIGTKDKVDKAWQLPNKTVAAKSYIVIYCDKAGEDEGYQHGIPTSVWSRARMEQYTCLKAATL